MPRLMSNLAALALLAGALLSLACSSAIAGTAASAGGPDLGLLLNYLAPDDDRPGDDHGLGATVLYGYPLGSRWSIEARLGSLVYDRGASDATQQDLGADAVYRFPSWRSWQPFVLAGLSIIHNDVDGAARDNIDTGFHFGAGALSAPLDGTAVRLRAELRYVHDTWLDGQDDFRLGLGVQVPLGGRVRPGFAASPSTIVATRDVDGDGVPPARDRCSDSLPYVRHDNTGCMQPDQLLRLYDVTFANGGSVLTVEARERLAAIARALRAQPALHARIDGHADSHGNAALNRQLSQERAAAVVTYLVLQGVAGHRLSLRAHGETEPVASNATAAGRKKNRRIEIVLLEPRRTAMELNQ